MKAVFPLIWFGCLLMCLGGSLPVAAQERQFVVPPPPPETAQFDFLIGTWDLTISPNLPNVPGTLHGRWTAKKAADSYLVTDEYRAFDDQGRTIYLGETYRVYDARKHQWDFRYLEPFHAAWYEGTGTKARTEMHLMQRSSDGIGPLLKIRIYNISANHFSWSSQRSQDGGKTWTSGATIEAVRRK